MTQLTIGKVSNQDLAEWFGATLNSITKKKKQWLKKLEDYCEFTPVYGGVEITKIYKSTYVKNKNYQIVKDNFDATWDESGLDSCSRVADSIYAEHENEFTVTPTTVYDHTRQVRNEFYGSPMTGEKGEKGVCSYVWCKRNKDGRLVALSEEEELIKKELMKKYYATTDEKTAIIQSMIESKEITVDEAWSVYSAMISAKTSYSGFMNEYKSLTGIQLIRGTLIEVIQDFEN